AIEPVNQLTNSGGLETQGLRTQRGIDGRKRLANGLLEQLLRLAARPEILLGIGNQVPAVMNDKDTGPGCQCMNSLQGSGNLSLHRIAATADSQHDVAAIPAFLQILPGIVAGLTQTTRAKKLHQRHFRRERKYNRSTGTGFKAIAQLGSVNTR